jgi:hypothetical protein
VNKFTYYQLHHPKDIKHDPRLSAHRNLDYDQISRYILPHLNYKHLHNLVVPHHGGNAGKYTYIIPKYVSVSTAIISVGVNHYKHPFPLNVKALRSSGSTVRKQT